MRLLASLLLAWPLPALAGPPQVFHVNEKAEKEFSYAQAVRVGNTLYVSGTTGGGATMAEQDLTQRCWRSKQGSMTHSREAALREKVNVPIFEKVNVPFFGGRNCRVRYRNADARRRRTSPGSSRP